MAWNKTDLAFKTLVNRVTTDSNKKHYEEFGDNTININSSEIWSYYPDFNNPNAAILAAIAEARGNTLNPFVLTEDITVPNQQAWYAGPLFDSRLKNWISPKYGNNYGVRLYDGNNLEIPQTDPSDWFFNYVNGILIFNGPTTGLVKPFKVVGYRYVGSFGSGGSNGLYSETNFVGQTVVNVYHGWGTKPNVTIIDALDQEFGGTYKYIDANNVQVNFESASTGSVILQSMTGSPIITTNLNGLSDVIITSPVTGDVLYFNGTLWVNQTASVAVTKFSSTVNLTANIPTTINHALSSTDIIVQCYQSSQMFLPAITIVDSNNITIESSVNKTGVRIIIQK